MKANQKFLKNDDDAVSPVIAVILMVAITVVLAATVYVWVSGFGASANNSQQHTLSVVSAGAITESPADNFYKRYTVSSADPTLTYGDMRISVDGNQYEFDAAGCSTAASVTAGDTVEWGACAGSTDRISTDLVKAGDTITVACYSAGASCLQDKGLIITDIEANSVMVTLTLR